MYITNGATLLELNKNNINHFLYDNEIMNDLLRSYLLKPAF